MAETEEFLVKKEIARRYKTTVKTLSKTLKRHEKEIGLPVGYTYSPAQVKKIKEIIGDFEII